MKKAIKNIIHNYLNENDESNVTLYHRISSKREGDLTKLLKSVVKNGLITHDNGEIGEIIWFSNSFNDYSKNGSFVVSIEYNDINKEKYEMYYDNHNGYAHKNIPFEELTVVKIPIVKMNNTIFTSDDMIRYINKKQILVDNFNSLNRDVILYKDLFMEYVQPFINNKDFIDKLDTSKIKMVNIFN